MSVYHTPSLYGYTLVGRIVWDDTPDRYHVTAVFKAGFGTGYAWGTDQGQHCETAHPFTGWETCDLDTGTAAEFEAELGRIVTLLQSRRHGPDVDQAGPHIVEVCAAMGIRNPTTVALAAAS